MEVIERLLEIIFGIFIVVSISVVVFQKYYKEGATKNKKIRGGIPQKDR